MLAAPLLGYADEDFVPGSYLFFLYYDQGKLFANRDFTVPYDVVTADFQEAAAGENHFKGEVLSAKGVVLAAFKFDPQNEKQNFKEGAIIVSAPYFFNAQQVDFYSNLGDKLVSVSVAEHSFCNDNGICEEKEDQETCPTDCSTLTPSPSGYLTIPDIPISYPRLIGNLGIIGAIIVAIIWGLWKLFKKLRKGKKNDYVIPPPQV